MSELAEIVKQRSPFLKLQAEESVIATYKGYKMVPSSYDPDKENFRFILEVEINGENQQKYWDTASGKVAMVFDALESGDKVKITKNVDNAGTPKEKTRWEVEPVTGDTEDEPSVPSTTAKVTEEEGKEIEESLAETEGQESGSEDAPVV
jgi:hypothetical protein